MDEKFAIYYAHPDSEIGSRLLNFEDFLDNEPSFDNVVLHLNYMGVDCDDLTDEEFDKLFEIHHRRH